MLKNLILKEAYLVTFCLILIFLTFLRNNIWKDDYTLWLDALNKSPSKARPYDNIGKVLENMGEYVQALNYYKKSLEFDPTYIWARHHLFNIYIKLNRPDEALAVIQDPSHQIIVEHEGLYKVLAEIYEKIGRYNEAESSYIRLIELAPDKIENYLLFGFFLINTGQSEKAIELFKKALILFPDNAHIYNNLGIAFEESGRIKEALSAYQKASELEPNAIEPIENMKRLKNIKNPN